MERIGENIWIVEGGNVDFYGFPYPTRSVIIRLPDGGLWIWSPIALTPELKAEVESLGSVKHLISPNKIHYLFLKDWKAAWPEAQLWGPQSTLDKLRKMHGDAEFERSFAGMAPLDQTAPVDWQGALDLVRFTGSVFMDELVFHHVESDTVILADLSENFDCEFIKNNWSKWTHKFAHFWGITVESGGKAPLEWRLSWFNKKQARAAREKVLSWGPRQVIMAHGAWQRENGRAFLEKSLSWI
ncbi:DUF4336 domain-containing protein [Aestuariispira insulae]|uniref:Uncharacterized protein DUF4336 n=1 Tax=Aestuariispira insulae TaxID=1461337 RepID=A0A3D9HW04_9PROT|nr:DUF4336 domain-containing protein [Aestuariispira insulae]RED53595.1 uncharacterized protein DUF4336 [Aestuariispira insulae]